MRNIIVITIAVLVVLANYAAWNKLRAEEMNNTQFAAHEVRVCKMSVNIVKDLFGDEMRFKTFQDYDKAHDYWLAKDRAMRKFAKTNLHVDFGLRKGINTVVRFSIDERREKADKCVRIALERM